MSKILVVEDDKDLAATVQKWLEAEHHLVELVHDGQRALDYLQASDYDLIVLDLSLPTVDGMTVCKTFRERGGETAILMLTGRTDVAEKERGLDTGADDYVTKPFSLREFAARVRAMLRRPRGVVSKSLQYQNIVLNPELHVVTKNGQSVHLLPQDFALLEHFMRHPGQIFTAEALIKRVWSTDSEATSDSVRSAIKRIRQKLDDEGDESHSIIETNRRVGYRLRQP
ncbi:MAG TPA: response regulator transcription factor [Planktothrix sp.]|jgi:DNA-binding response OmpR family regulator